VSWTQLLLYAVPGFPLALTLLVLIPKAREALFKLLPIAPLPALLAALMIPGEVVQPLPRTLLGAALMLGETGRFFLGAGAFVWIVSGVFARASVKHQTGRFAGFWLATLSGNMLLFVSADVVTFYLAFATLSLAAFGLVIHDGTPEARRAGRVYLVLAVLGETCLLLGLWIGTNSAETLLIADVRGALAIGLNRDLAIGLLVAGFGLKAGLMPLHVWLPLAHPAAPVAASAVLSGAIVNAGIFGLLIYLPLEADMPRWRTALVVLGLVTAYGGVVFGVMQARAKTVLAYSTLSQMGLVVALVGSGFGSTAPGQVLAAATFYCVHHGLAKGALFLSVGVVARSGVRSRRLLMLLAGIAALAVAGLPLTGGALAKLAIKGPMGDGMASAFVSFSAVGTTLLMLRFLQLIRRTEHAPGEPSPGVLAPFLACLAAALVLPWMVLAQLTQFSAGYALHPDNLLGALWPIAAGAAVTAAAFRAKGPRRLEIPEGDMVVLIERAGRRAVISMRRFDRANLSLPYPRVPPWLWHTLDDVERSLSRWPVVGAILLGACVVVVAAVVS
jgi:hydrogenase-4 component B